MGAHTYLHHTSNAYHKDFHHTYACDNAKVIVDMMQFQLCFVELMPHLQNCHITSFKDAHNKS